MSLATLFQSAWRRRWLIACITILLTAADISAALLLPRSYRAEVLMQVDRRAARTVDGNVPALEQELDGGALAGQVDIVRSPAIALRVIQELDLLEQADFEPLRAQREPAGSVSGPRAWIQAAKDAVATYLPPHLADRLRGTDLQEEHLVAAREEAALIRAFQKRLYVSYDLRGGGLRIAYVSRDPALAAAVANAVASAYVDDQLRRKLDLLRGTSAWLDERLETLRVKAVEAEGRLAEFRQVHGLGTAQAPAFAQQQLAELHSQLTGAMGQQAQAEARLRAAEEAAAGRRSGSLTEIVTSRTITALREQEAHLNRRIAELVSGGNLRTAMDARAELADLLRRIAEEQERILGAIRSDAIAARTRRASLEATIAQVTAEAQRRDGYSIQAAVLEREAAANRAVFDAAVRRTEEARLLDGLQRPDLAVISPARMPGNQSSPNMLLIALFGFATSLLTGFSIALFLEYRNVTVRSVSQGESALGLAGLGWLPAMRTRRRSRVHDLVVRAPADLYSECVRSVAVSLRGLGPSGRQLLLVTSASPLEGKTSFALSYGRMLAAARHECLLIDADLRRPAVQERLGGGDALGLTDVLAGKASLAEAIAIDEASGLIYMGAGQTAVDPLWSLESPAFEELLAKVRERFRVVILDAPPVLPVSDGVLLARRVDAVVLIVAWNRTPVRAVLRAIARLSRAGAREIGFVLSGVDVSQVPRTEGERQAAVYYGRAAGTAQRAPALRLVRSNEQ
ncbi:GumC family protein [Roseicella aerolata]|uniref:Polysaccharide chain length determinant N-terminal domain-containing protein n=1 Tax=Roseicella aerolata TaxID=2883479 RepID=A0A9X1IJ80_9PROT|nr:Wzz/FepE/Etk N-terminal domain-containing protein [Roseicella aerolata]MCB4825119.1 hypothetical protein [Roseicella aerolata]